LLICLLESPFYARCGGVGGKKAVCWGWGVRRFVGGEGRGEWFDLHPPISRSFSTHSVVTRKCCSSLLLL